MPKRARSSSSGRKQHDARAAHGHADDEALAENVELLHRARKKAERHGDDEDEHRDRRGDDQPGLEQFAAEPDHQVERARA